MQRIGTDERRARLGVRHHLALPAGSSDAAAAGMVGLHSSDPVSPFLSARARVDGFVHADLEDALYERAIAGPHAGDATHAVRGAS